MPHRIAKETKFGYGFLLVGSALPYLIDKLFGPIAALIVASICLVAGVALLVAAHLHRDKSGIRFRRGLMGTIGMFALIGATAGALIGSLSGAIWKISKDKPDQVPSSKPLEASPGTIGSVSAVPQQHETTDAASAAMTSTNTRGTVNPTKRAPKAQKTVPKGILRISDIQFGDLIEGSGLLLTIVIKNVGTEACYGLKYSAALAVDKKIKAEEENARTFAALRAAASPEPGPTTDEIPPGRTTFFRYYVEDLKTKADLDAFDGRHKLLYLSLVLRYGDSAGKWETGFCGHYVGPDRNTNVLCQDNNYEAHPLKRP